MIKEVINLQFFRFVLVGLASNLILYLIYLLVTYYGVRPTYALSVIYLIGIIQTYLFNKNWTFSHQGRVYRTFFRYSIIYGVSYLINLAVLILFVDLLDFPHQLVQGLMIPLIALLLFGMQKIWDFRVIR